MHLVHVATVTEKDGERASERARGRKKEQERGREIKERGDIGRGWLEEERGRGGKGREKAVDAPGEGADAKLTFDSCFFQHTPPRN